MKIQDLFEGTKVRGSYIGVHYSKESVNRLNKFAKSLKIDDIIDKDKYHSTIIYSTKPLPKAFKAIGKYKDPIIVQPKRLDIFDTDDGGVLVLKLDAPELVKRHKLLMKEYDLKFDYPNFTPHITLCYKLPDNYKLDKTIDLSSLKDLEVTEEYLTQLEKNWTDDEYD